MGKFINIKQKKSMKKVFEEVSQLVEKFGTKKTIAIVIITMLVSLMIVLSSCNVTRIVRTEASHYQKGDTTTTIVTKTTETYEGTKK